MKEFSVRVQSVEAVPVMTLAIFLIAFIPRLLGLGGFLTTDERFWIESSRDFLGGVVDREFDCPAKTEHKGQSVLAAGQGLTCTIRAGHPGVTTMWSGALGLWLHYLVAGGGEQSLVEFLRTMPVKPVDPAVIPWVRAPTAILAAAGIAALFWLVARLLADQGRAGLATAAAAALLSALAPYEMALARVLHTDALETIFATLSILTLFTYWRAGASRRWLLASGLLAGFSFLSKSPALFLIPFAGLLGLVELGRRWITRSAVEGLPVLAHWTGRMVIDGLLWLVVAGGTYVAVWPAMWVTPLSVYHYVFAVVFGYATELDDKGNFFLGQFVLDPGPWFYPVTWLFRTTPLAVIGALLGAGVWLLDLPKVNAKPCPFIWRWPGFCGPHQSRQGLLFLSLLFILSFTLFLNLSGTKQVRYYLPVYPFLNIVAAAGLVWLTGWLLARLPQANRLKRLPVAGHVLLIGAVVAWHGLLVVGNFPYYFTYFNPLVGGAPAAQRVITVGWGEGLDQAAAYLNRKPNAAELTVASWYGDSSFGPFFKGHTLDYFRQKGNVLAADYVITYIHQWQRQLPDNMLFQFLESRADPEQVIELAGIPYIKIYPGLGLDHHLTYDRYHGLAELLGWEYVTPGVDPDQPVLSPGDTLDFELWWEYLGKPAEESFFLWLVDAGGQIKAETTTRLAPDAGDPAAWETGKIVRELGRLKIPAEMPAGEYKVFIGFYPEGQPDPVQALLFGLDGASRTVIIGRSETSPRVVD